MNGRDLLPAFLVGFFVGVIVTLTIVNLILPSMLEEAITAVGEAPGPEIVLPEEPPARAPDARFPVDPPYAGSGPARTEVAGATAKPSHPPTIADAKAWALRRLGRTQFGCLSALVQRESRWRVNATNRATGAYGLPQALPGSKMARFGSDWKTNPVTQLRWMIAYVNGRYGSACSAYSVALAQGWY